VIVAAIRLTVQRAAATAPSGARARLPLVVADDGRLTQVFINRWSTPPTHPGGRSGAPGVVRTRTDAAVAP